MINGRTSKKDIEEWARHLFADLNVTGIVLLTTGVYFTSHYSL